ncbi:MAG: potassium channel family protein [Desulfovibrio sp.]|uniref:potassium channel family protein n=1 Tax=Desulfovibrio sp. 7SRBS1 TaxID=3378064 RepID=UPI003B3FEF9A
MLASFFSLSVLNEFRPLIIRITHDDVVWPMLLIAFGNGLLIATVAALVKKYLRRKQLRGHKLLLSSVLIEHQDVKAAWLVGFGCGVLSIVLIISSAGLLVLTLFTVWMVRFHIRRFGMSAVELLRPENTPTWDDIGRLSYIYLLLVTAFTLINASLDMSCEYLNFPRPFLFTHGPGLLIDSLYFTVVLLTTVGFGDIHAMTAVGKVFVTFECLIGYVIFALLIGIVTGGVTRGRD